MFERLGQYKGLWSYNFLHKKFLAQVRKRVCIKYGGFHCLRDLREIKNQSSLRYLSV